MGPQPHEITFYVEMPGNIHWGQNAAFAPDWGQALWGHACVVPAMKMWMTFYDEVATADGMATELVKIRRYLTSRRRDHGLASDRWALTLFNGGQHQSRWSAPLMHHPADGFVCFTAKGVEANRAIHEPLAEACARRFLRDGVDPPEMMLHVSENGPTDDEAQGSLREEPAGSGKWEGWLDRALGDPRAKTEEVTGRGKTLKALADRPIPGTSGQKWPGLLTNLSSRHPSNRMARERWHSIARLAWDWSRYKGLFLPFQNVWPEMELAEYGAFADSGHSPVHLWPAGPGRVGMDGMFFTPCQGPEWYGRTWAYDQPELEAEHLGWESKGNVVRTFPKDPDAPGWADEALWASVQHMTRILRGIAAQGRPMVLWLSLSQLPTDRGTDCHVLELLKNYWLLGGRACCIWESNHAVQGDTAERWSWIITRLNGWIQTRIRPTASSSDDPF